MSYRNLTKKELLEMVDDLECEVGDLEDSVRFNDGYDCDECIELLSNIEGLQKKIWDLEEQLEDKETEIRDLEHQLNHFE